MYFKLNQLGKFYLSDIIADNGDIKYIFSDLEKIKALNEYFSSISNVDESGTNLPDNYQIIMYCVKKLLSDIVIQEHEIHDIISILHDIISIL
jgi:hypothetical protein